MLVIERLVYGARISVCVHSGQLHITITHTNYTQQLHTTITHNNYTQQLHTANQKGQ